MSEENTANVESTEEVRVRGIHNSTENTGASVVSPMGLHGRRQIFTNVERITAANVVEVLNKALPTHNRNRQEIIYLEDYLRGIQPILKRVKQYRSEINNKVVVNIANQIVTFKTAEFAGKPIQYISRGQKEGIPEEVEKLTALMLSEGKQSKDMELAYKMYTCGVGYRLILRDKAEAVSKGELQDEAPFEIYIPEPRNTFVIRSNDVTRKVLGGVTYVFLDEAQSEVEYTVYTDTDTFKVLGTGWSVGGSVSTYTHRLGFVPLIEYPCNNIYMGAFEPVLPLLDAYNNIESNRVDGVEQFIQAIMVFEGVDVTNEQLDAIKERGALKIPPTMDGRTGKVYYLNEQLDQAQTQTLVDDLYNTILQVVGMPSQSNGSTSDSSNNGAALIKNGWWNAEARNLETVGSWERSETEFLKIVIRVCEQANVLFKMRVGDVTIKFDSHSYEDKLVKTQSFTTLIGAGVPPVQAYTVSGMLGDPEAAAIAFIKYQEERAAEMDKEITKTPPVSPEVETADTEVVSE